MPRKGSKDLGSELRDAAAELQEEEQNSYVPGSRKLEVVAKKLLLLERDLNIPGAGVSDSARVQRIMESIENEDF